MMTPDDPLLGERVAQIKLQRQETQDRITLLERELNTQAYQLTPEKIVTFGTLLREQLKNGSVEFRKAYLNLFIDRIEVDDSEIRIRGPVAALAGGASGKLPKPSDAVPSYVREWRTRRDSNSRPLPSEGRGWSISVVYPGWPGISNLLNIGDIHRTDSGSGLAGICPSFPPGAYPMLTRSFHAENY